MNNEEKLEQIIGQALGEASMQWHPRPSGVFDSSECSKIVDRTCDQIAKHYAEKVETLSREKEKLVEILDTYELAHEQYRHVMQKLKRKIEKKAIASVQKDDANAK
jgi:hypothetical protein